MHHFLGEPLDSCLFYGRYRTGTPFTQVILQIHYLLPLGGGALPGPLDHSGMRLHLAHGVARRRHDARMIGFMDTAMRIPAGKPARGQSKRRTPPTSNLKQRASMLEKRARTCRIRETRPESKTYERHAA